MNRIVLDYGNMMRPRLDGRGIDPAALDEAAARFHSVHAGVEAGRAAGRLGFLKLPYEREIVGNIRAFGDGPGQAFDTIVVLGIGGSALGATALRNALRQPFWNELDDEAREYYPRLYVLDNVDPSTIGPLLARLDPARTLVNVISKSGTTAETMAQFLIVREWLRAALDDGYRGHLLFTTDPDKGVLRRIAEETGGRFYTAEPAAGMAEDVRYAGRGVTSVEERELWNMPIILIALVGLVCAEWGYRRAVGMA